MLHELLRYRASVESEVVGAGRPKLARSMRKGVDG